MQMGLNLEKTSVVTMCIMNRISLPLSNAVRKFAALVAANLIFPALAFAGHDNGKGNDRQNNGPSRISAVPEANTGWVLLPFLSVVLLFSARHLFRAKATE